MLRGFIAAMPPDTLPTEADLQLNLPVLLFTLAATTLAGLLFGCAPAWYAARLDPAETLKEGGRSGSGRSGSGCAGLWLSASSRLRSRSSPLPVLPCTASGTWPMSIWA